MKTFTLAFAVAAAFFATAAQADTTAVNSTPADGWFYGNGNNYSPANTEVLTTAGNDQLYLRWHERTIAAPASDANAVYKFPLGMTNPLSYDWGFDNNANANVSALITVKSLKTGGFVTYDPQFTGNDNAHGSGSTQNSANLDFFFLAPVGYNKNVDDTYSVTLNVNGLAGGSKSLTAYAQVGVGAVPEPATWAMMLLGFGGVGAMVRRKHQLQTTLA